MAYLYFYVPMIVLDPPVEAYLYLHLQKTSETV